MKKEEHQEEYGLFLHIYIWVVKLWEHKSPSLLAMKCCVKLEYSFPFSLLLNENYKDHFPLSNVQKKVPILKIGIPVWVRLFKSFPTLRWEDSNRSRGHWVIYFEKKGFLLFKMSFLIRIFRMLQTHLDSFWTFRWPHCPNCYQMSVRIFIIFTSFNGMNILDMGNTDEYHYLFLIANNQQYFAIGKKFLYLCLWVKFLIKGKVSS